VRQRREIARRPTDPCAGIRGTTPALIIPSSASITSTRTPEQPSATTCARSSIIARTSASPRSGPTPAA
jgi:hypothetical protein